MPVYKVLMRVDAYSDYVALVEADDAEDAALVAYHGEVEWEHVGVDEFDDRLVVTLDTNNDEIESTRCGDF